MWHIFLLFDHPQEKNYFKANFWIENSRFSSLLFAWDVSPGESLSWPILILRPRLTCSAGVVFGRANVLMAKAHIKTRKEGRKWGESKNNSTNINKQLSAAQNTPVLQTRPRTKKSILSCTYFCASEMPFQKPWNRGNSHLMHMCIRFNFFADLREIESEKSTLWVKQTNPMESKYRIYSINRPGRLLNFWTFRVSAYSKWALIRGWAVIKFSPFSAISVVFLFCNKTVNASNKTRRSNRARFL